MDMLAEVKKCPTFEKAVALKMRYLLTFEFQNDYDNEGEILEEIDEAEQHVASEFAYVTYTGRKKPEHWWTTSCEYSAAVIDDTVRERIRKEAN